MKKIPKFLAIIVPIIWIIIGLSLYFLQVNSLEGSCKIFDGCLKIGDKGYSIGLNKNHQYYPDSIKEAFGFGSDQSHQPGPILYIIIGISFLYIANMLYDRIAEKRKKLKLNLTPFHIILIFSVIFFIVYNRWISFYQLEEPIKHASIFIKYPLIILGLLLTALISLSTGSFILKKIFGESFLEKEKYFKSLSAFSTGTASLMIIFYFMALFGSYKLVPIIILFVLILAFSYKELWHWIKEFFVVKIKIETEYLSAPVLLLFVLMIVFAHNFLELIRPIPIGFDDLSVYITNAKAMAESGASSQGIMSYYWELFYGLGFILFKSGTMTLMMSTLVGMFSLVAIFILVRNYCKERNFNDNELVLYPSLAAVLFYSLPMVVFQSSSDLKVDMAAFMFTTTSLIYFFRWRKDYLKNKIIENRELYFAAILAGFGFAIKYTNIIFLFILLVYLAFIIYSKHKFDCKKYIIAAMFLILSLIPVLPISIRNIVQTHSISISSIRFGKTDDKIIKIDPPFSKEVKEPNYKKYMESYRTEDREELGRYTGYDAPFKKYLLLPLKISTNSLSRGLYVDISYLFIIFVPLGYFSYLYLKSRKEADKKPNLQIFKEILLFAALFWVIWLFIASGVIWYGLAGIVLLIIIVIEAIKYFRDTSKILGTISIALVIIWFVLSLFLKSAYLPSQSIYVDSFGLKYARGDLNQESYINTKFTSHAEIIKNINKDIESHPDNPPKIYRVGTFLKYFITRSNETVIDDLLLEKFAYASQDDDYDKILQRFKNSGIKYLIIDKTMYEFDKTPEQSLFAKTTKLINFINSENRSFKLLTDPNDENNFIAEIK